MARYGIKNGRLPSEEDDGVTDLQDNVLGLLGAAGIPTDINDKIIDLVREGEQRLQQTPE